MPATDNADSIIALGTWRLLKRRGQDGDRDCHHGPASARRPKISKHLPGPRAAALVTRDADALSTSFTRPYPLVVAKGEGLWIEDVDGNQFLDFTAGIAVTATGHSHPKVVEAIEKQVRLFLHMSGTDFYYEPQVRLASAFGARRRTARERLFELGRRGDRGRHESGAIHAPHALLAFTGASTKHDGRALADRKQAVQRDGFAPLVPAFSCPIPSASGAARPPMSLSAHERVPSPAKPRALRLLRRADPGEGGYSSR